MNALLKKEDNMSVEDRLASLESDVKYLRNDMTDVKPPAATQNPPAVATSKSPT
jgi:hypothetical protein